MDTSKKYIKMCEKAEEIQTKNFIWVKCFKIEDGCEAYITPFGDYCAGVNQHIWLPRQDQLQEMLTYLDNPRRAIALVCDWIVVNLKTPKGQKYMYNLISSMEQLWLAFVMYEKFNKIWDDEKEEWIEK